MIKKFFILLLAIVASVGMSFAQASIVSSGTKGGMSYTFYDNGLLEISGSGALPGRAFTNWDGGFGTSVKNIRFAEDCEVYGLGDMWFGCYTENAQLETIEINSVVPIMFSGSGEGIFYRQDGAVTLTITAPAIVDVESGIIGNYGSPVNMIFNMPATTVFERKWFSGLENNFAVTIPTGAKGHIPAGYSFKDPYDQKDYDDMVAHDMEDLFWESHSYLVEGVDYTNGEESTFVITAENASQIFGQASVSFQAPTEASNSEWVLWRKSDLKTFSDMSSGDKKVYKDVTVKVNNGVYNTDSGWGIHFDSSDEDGVQFVAPEGKVFKRIVILNEYGTFSDPNWSYDKNYKKWSGSADTVGFVGNICGISLIEFELEASAPAAPAYETVMNLINEIPNPAVLTAECKAKIDAARAAYDALSTEDKALVTNYSTLTNAEEAWQALIPDPVVLPTVKYAVCNVPDGWAVTANGDAVLPINGRYHIADGQTVVLTPPASTEVGSITSAEEAGLLGAGTAEDPYLIYTVAHWNAVAAKVNDGTQAAPNCRQMANLDGVTTVMGNSESKPFKGIYDGNGFVFTNINLSITSGSNPLGLFGCVNDASAVVKNVVVAGGTVSSTSQNVGAIVGQLNGGTVQYCANYATVSSSYNGKVRMGGIVGWMRSAGGDNNRVNYCINYGNVSGVGYVGGITGSYGAGNVNYCQNYGSISSSGTDNATSGSAGGIIGWDAADDATKITYNHNGGNITLTQGHTYKPSRYIIANTNSSDAKSLSVIVPSSNSYLSSLTLTIGSTNYTGADLATHEPNAQVLDINPEGIAISGITYAYGVAAPIAPAPGTNPGTDPAKQSNKTWQFTMPSHNIGLTVIIYPAEVIAKIAAIPTPVTLKLATRDAINNARAAYEALNAEQKALVPAADLQKLTDAEAALAALNPGGGMPADALNGKFTINEDGDQIAFAKGNLQATTEDLGEHWTWGFAANQWNYLGIAVANSKINGNGTVSENGTVDLFGWSTAATYYGINNSYKAADYPGDFVDWGPKMGAGWRTLTKDEWQYLIENNTKGRATVNDKNGYIFLPNDWSGPAFTPDPDNFTTNVYSGDDWTAMENAGAVFLPSGPARNGTYALIANDARYYSSTSLNNDSSYVFTIYYNQSQSACTGTNRAYGCMVRLVTAGGATPLDSALAVKDLIEAIPMPVTLDDACVNAVQAARDAYNALSDATKGALDDATVQKLNQAITDYTALIKAEADAVTAKIAAIPQPVTLKLATRDSIQNARAAYDALTADQQALVTNYQTLLDAEATWATLNPGGGMPAGALSGKFTINADGDQIMFAKGNLQATTTDLGAHWTWGFAANQWDLIGNAAANNAVNGNKTVSENGTVDLFGWSTPTTYYGIHNSKNSDYYSGDFREWGENITGATWKTPSPNDWIYIISNRADAAQKQGQATVNGVNGYIFLPDEWELPTGLSFTAKPNNWTANVYEGDDWTAMENAGAVFLPKSPWRSENTVATITYGYYWSSDYNNYSNAMAYYFKEDASITGTGTPRYAGICVRLVTAGGGGATPLDSAQAVKDLIDAIPVPVSLADSCVNAIQAARAGYDALDTDAKAILDAADVKKLTDAEAALTALNQAEADKVIAKIALLPNPVQESDLKLSVYDKVVDARTAFDALNAAQQALVTNYQTLLDAEAAFDAIGGGGGPAFSVNASGDVVVFAPGNLQATLASSTWTWSFAANQWDIIGNAAANTSVNGNGTLSADGTVDLFGWVGNSSTVLTDGMAQNGISNSKTAEDYGNVTGEALKSDWSTFANANSLGGRTDWRLLTNDEWAYIINTRSATYRYCKATVNNVIGLVIFPDDYSHPSGVAAIQDANNTKSSYASNVWTAEDWALMATAGATFLPAGGYRVGADVYDVESTGRYWTSASHPQSAASAYGIDFFYLGSTNGNVRVYGLYRYYGASIRLAAPAVVSAIAQAQAAVALINAIPDPVTLDEACVKAIKDAREAVTALGENAKLIDAADMTKLTDAEAALTALNQAEADKVIAKINNIPLPVELKLATRDSIQNARTAYDALTADQQALVSNYTKLTDAEAALAALVPTPTPEPVTPTVWDMNELKVGDIIYEGDQLMNTSSPRYINNVEVIRDNKCPYTLMKSAGETSYVLKDKDGSYLFTDGSLAITPTSVGLLVTNADQGDINVVVYSPANVLDSAQAVKDLIDAIPTPVEYPTSGAAIEAALVAYNELSDAAKGALDDADVQKLNDAATQYAALEAIAAIEEIPAEIVYDPAVKAAIETAREKYDALSDASKALVNPEVLHKLTNAEEAWAILVAKIEHNVSYIGKDGELKHETVALFKIPDPAPEFNGYEFARWDVKAGDFLEEGLRIKAVYTPIITTNPVAYDSLMYNGAEQTLITAGVAKEGHIEYRINDGEWSTELPKATFAAAYVVYYKLVREGHPDYIADSIVSIIAKAPVTYTAPTAVDSLVYTASNQTLIAAGQTNDGTFEYSLDPTLLDSWKAELPQAKDAGTYSVYYRVQGDLNHLDSVAATPVAVTIAKAALTATADDKTVIYGGAVPAYTVTYAGWQGTDDASVLNGDIAFACTYAPTSNVGEYTITPSGVSAANYNITFVNGKVTVEKAESGCLAPVAFDTLVYNGAAQTLIIAGQPVGGEIQYSLDTTVADCWKTELPQAKDAGTYNVYYRVQGDGNHNDSYYDLIAVKIAKAALTATAEDKTVTYGDAAPTYTVAYAGWKGTDEASVLTGTIAFACEYAPLSNVGDYTIIPSGVDAANYNITFVNGTLTVVKAPVAYVAPVANELIYTAAAQTLITAGTTNDGQFVYRLGTQGDFDGILPQATHVGAYDVYYKVLGDGNHLDSIIATPVAVNIDKAELTATADNKTVIFGEPIPAYTVTYTGWLGNDKDTVLTGAIAYACEYVKGSAVGEYVITPSGVDAADYNITFVNGTLTVNRKSAKSADIAAKQADNEKLVYDAEANKPTIIVKDTTLVLTENQDYKLTFIGRGNTEYAENATAPAHVGEYTAIVAFIGNYKDTLTVDFVINKAPLTITAENKAITFGEFAPDFTVAYKGWQGTDTATVLTGVQAYACEYVRGNKVGEYTIIPSGVDAHDYDISFVNGTLTVNRKSAKSADIAAKQADNEKLVYDAEVNRPSIIVKDTTLVLTEAQDYVLTFKGVAADQSTYAESATAPTHVGNYTAVVAFIGNYKDTLTVDFAINKAPLTITANDTAMIYGDVAPEFTVSYAGFHGNDDKTVLLGTQAYDCPYAPGSSIGTYVITPKGVDAYDYEITFVNGTLTVNKAHVFISGAEVHTAKFADGHANAVVTNNGVLNGIKLNDPIAHVTTATFSSADVAEHLTITLFYELTGDAALLKNYNLDPTSEIYSTEGVIIEPFIPNDEHEPEEDEQVEVQEGIDVYAYGYCDGSGYSLKYHLNSGNPDQYKIEFEDSRFTDVDWTNLTTKGKDGTIDIEIPVDLPTGDYSMTVYFRDSRFDWLESQALSVTFHVNLPETYVRPLFDNVIALVDTCHCLTDIQWYWRANSSEPWQPIPGATGYYYHADGKLTGEYFVSAKMNGVPTYTCGQADMETLYGDDKPKAEVKAYPNPIIDRVNVTIEGSEEWTHNLRVVNLMGSEVINTNFDGNETVIEMIGVPQGNYMISVDGIVVKVMKQ